MSLVTGSRLGPYEIVAPIGAGGMGEVYKARDTRLDRTVAIKILPPALAADPQFRERFDREARTSSQLDHPNICAIYDVGEQAGTAFLVMQFVEGETLAARLERGALPMDQALAIAIQIATALDKAHRAGIVHRDLKPANIMLTKGGSASAIQAKLLDFGLAKPTAPAIAVSGMSMLPTTPPQAITAQGTILGTFQYMAPEQIEGAEADARADIFAFGCVMYEMVTGARAFEGKTAASLLGAILHATPAPIAERSPVAPRALDRLVSRCLAKEPDERWQTARDIVTELKWIAGTSSSQSTVAAPSPESAASLSTAGAVNHRRRRLLRGAVAVALAVVAGVGGYLLRTTTAELRVLRFTIDPPEGLVFQGGAPLVASSTGSISPDGRRVVFPGKDASGRIQLYVRELDQLTARALPGTDNARYQFWSADSRSVAFFAGNKVRRVDLAGGASQPLADAAPGRGGSWSRDDVILFSSGPVYQVRSTGGEAVAVTTLANGDTQHIVPSVLPDGRHFLFLATPSNVVYLGDLKTGNATRLFAADSKAVYASPGYVLFIRQQTLFAQPFDARTLAPGGDPIPVVDNVAADTPLGGFSVSDVGVLIYRNSAGGSGGQSDAALLWLDRSGNQGGGPTGVMLSGPGGITTGRYVGIDLSPDGTRVAFHRHEGTGGDIWIGDVARDTAVRLTFSPDRDNANPVWSPDGARIAFAASHAGKSALYAKPADGSGDEELLFESEQTIAPTTWSPDGKWLVFSAKDVAASPSAAGLAAFDRRASGERLWLLSIASRKATPLLDRDSGQPRAVIFEEDAQFSPDGRWIAYSSNEIGGKPQIYVRPFPSLRGQWQLSTDRGEFPRWRGDGRELFFYDLPSGGRLMSVSVRTSAESTFEYDPPKMLSATAYPINPEHRGPIYHHYAVAPDGQRFLIPRATSGSFDAGSLPIVVVVNWTAALNRR